MAIRLTLECGHSSVLRERTTPEGFTHDWEVFVRGVDNADIHHYVEKVVFQLHETFAKPKRVIKEPPYVVKESGYAGFLIPIHIYLKNKDEPKRFQILYKLSLQPRGRIINKVIRHNEIINNPSEEFRRKLLKGGGVIIPSTESTSDRGEIKTPVMVGKPKLSVGEPKKHRLVESKTSNSFAELFGPPIKTAKISPESKKVMQSEKSSTVKPIGVPEKIEKVDKLTKSKDSPHKDTKKEKTEEKKDKKVKDPSKEKSRSKEKSKRPPSPGSKGYSSPTNKRPSPPPIKRPRSPSPPSSIKRAPSPKSKEKDIKRSVQEKEREKEKEKEKEKEREKERDKDKTRDSSKSSLDINKTEKKKDKKKYKDEAYKEKKEKYKEGERSGIKEAQKINDKKLEKAEKEKEKSQDYKSVKDGRKSPKPVKESDKIKDEKLPKVDKLDKEKSEKVKENKSDKDRTKHKHKKKDKKEKRDSSREREKKEKREKSKSSGEKQNNLPASSNPLTMLFANMPERDSSDSAPSVDDDSFVETKPVLNVKKELDDTASLTLPMEAVRPPSPPPVIEIKKEKSDRSKREKPKGNRGEERENRKRKRRSESKGDDEHNLKREKDRSHSTSPLLEPVSSSQSPVVVDVDSIHMVKEKEDRHMGEQTIKKEGETDGEQVAPDSTNCPLVESDTGEPPVFNEDYVSQLKDLQHKIMTLQDNQELQRVVQVIEETGQYEITKKTFDFDLCALDRRTVQRLQQFFSAS